MSAVIVSDPSLLSRDRFGRPGESMVRPKPGTDEETCHGQELGEPA